MGERVSVDPEAGTVTAVRTIRKSGNSVVLTIPPQVLEGAGLEVGDDVEIVADMTDGGISITAVDAD